MIADHELTVSDPALARALSRRVTSSVEPGTKKSYSSGFNSLKRFCEGRGLPYLPTDRVTLGAWLHFEATKGKPTKLKSLKKYMSGIRWEHIVNGFTWPFSGDAWLKLVTQSIGKEFPEVPFFKVPFTEHLLRELAEQIPGWPKPRDIRFNDLLWLCASAIGFFACLRGGELAHRKGADRPPLRGKDVILQSGGGKGVTIRIRKPKTQPGSAYQIAMAKDPTEIPNYPLNPSALLVAFRKRAARRSIDVTGENAAFRFKDGKPLTLDFLMKRTEELRVEAGIEFQGLDGELVRFRAASYRAGHVLSARMAKVPEVQIRATGRWASDGGPAPYSMSSEVAYASASTAIALAGAKTARAAVYKIGAFSSSLAVFQATEGWESSPLNQDMV